MTDIRLHNSMTRRKEAFAPLDPANVRMYACGPTVYDRAHIGNARPAVVFDTLYRLLRHVYGPEHVTYVRNITDIDDKIIARAKESGAPIDRITAETTEWYHEDMAALGVDYSSDPQFHEPRATEFVPQMVAMIGRLIERGFAYEAEGHVLFEVGKFKDYGRLSGRSTEDMIAGARVEVAPYKRDPMDFVLWKPSSDDQPGWDSPWGRGRPGWHIECSAMSETLLGQDFDIHAGGADLQFPHHENEIAQSVCSCDACGFARVWLHNGMIRVGGQKMAKSLGNFTTVHDLRETVPGDVIRLAMLMTHYRDPLDWTDDRVQEATALITRWRRALDVAEALDADEDYDDATPADLVEALADDLNTSLAVRALDRLAGKLLSDAASEAEKERAAPAFLDALGLLGFEALEGMKAYAIHAQTARLGFTGHPATITVTRHEDISSKIDALLDERLAARKAKDFARADAIRDGLTAAGVMVKDTGAGAEWELTPAFDATKLAEVEA